MINQQQQIPACPPAETSAKAGYKQADVGLIPADWEVKELRDLCDFKSGKALENQIVENGDYFLITLNSLDIKGNFKIDHLKVKRNDGSINKDDLIMILSDVAHGNFLGLTNVIPKDNVYVLNQRVGALKNVRLVKSNYLSKYINLKQSYFKTVGQGSSQQNLGKDDILNFKVLFPPNPEEQAYIIEVLSDVDSLISKLDHLIQKMINIKKGAMQEFLTGKRRLPGFKGEWGEKKLDQIADFYKGSGLSKSEITNDGKYPCILYGELFTTYSEVINQVLSHTNAIEGLASKKGDILLPGSTTTSGIDLATASSLEVEYVLLGGDMIVLRKKTNEAFNSQFLAYYLTHISKYKIAEISQGITIIHLHGNRLKDISIFVPFDIKEQDAISKIIIDMSSEILLLESQRKKYNDLKEGMMQQLLTGKIRLI